MDNVPQVVEFLRQSSKGRLRYDKHGTDESLQASVLEIIRLDNCLVIPLRSLVLEQPQLQEIDKEDKIEMKMAKNDYDESKDPKLQTIDSIDVAEIKDKLLLDQYETERQRDVEKSTSIRKSLWNAECCNLALNAEKQFEMWHQQLEVTHKEQYEKEITSLAKRKLKVQQMLEGLKESNERVKESKERRKSFFSAEIKKLELKQKQIEQQNVEKLEVLRRQQELRNSLVECQRQINFKSNKIVEILKNRTSKQYISEAMQHIILKQRSVVEAINHLVSEKREKQVVDNDLHTAQVLDLQVEENLQNLIIEIEKENLSPPNPPVLTPPPPPPVSKQIETSHYFGFKGPIHNEPNVVLTPPQPPISIPISTPIESTHSFGTNVPIQNEPNVQNQEMTINQPEEIVEEAKEKIYQYITRDSLKEYVRIKNLLLQYREAYGTLASDISPRMKKYKFALQKAVNLPVNAISPLSGSHLRDKLVRLKTLLQGQPVDVGDNRRVSTNEHNQALVLSKDLLAKKFVRQGDEQVAAKYESAFAIATVIIGLWADIPDFGDLFLGHLHERCPYTVPYYVAREENQSQEDYYKAQGYLYTDGIIEKQDKFLKRMSGIVRLYFSVICTPMPRVFNKPHPHGLENGWKWLTRILNLEPRPDLTATIIFDFLETVGYAMQQNYRNQFNKLLAILWQNYLPKIRQITPGGSGGPLTRLENFLEKCAQRNKIPPPEGLLSESFWYS